MSAPTLADEDGAPGDHAAAMPFFLDANVLMYALGEEHPRKQACTQVLELIENDAIQVVSNAEVLQEVLHRYRSLQKFEIGAKAFMHFKVLCEEIWPVDEDDLDRALELLWMAPGIKVRDAIHAASMLNRHHSKILSTDTHFDLIEGITRVAPADLAGERAG